MPRKSASQSLADQSPATGGVLAVDRALTLLGTFTVGASKQTLSELAAKTTMHKSTVLRLLASLMHARLVQRHADDSYGLGAEVARLQDVYLSGFSLSDVVRPVLKTLSQNTRESVAYSVLQKVGNEAGTSVQRLCLYRANSDQLLRDHLNEGDLLPLNRGAGGRVLVAFMNEVWLKEAKLTHSRKDKALMAQIRERGYYAAVGDRSPDLGGIAAPVFHADGRLAASLTLTMPATRYNPSHISLVMQAAKALCGRV